MWGLEVWQPFCRGKSHWAPATVEYRYDTGVEANHLLQINQRGVTTGDLDAFHQAFARDTPAFMPGRDSAARVACLHPLE
jgi:hypothetical protein